MNTTYLLILAVAVIMGWYALGTWTNVRRGEALLRWMQAGLPRLGEKTTFRWLGSSVVELIIADGKTPVRRAEVLLALRPRDVPWTWLYAVLTGRHDVFIVRLDLVGAPPRPFELADPKTWTGRMALQHVQSQGWERHDHAGKSLLVPTGMLNLTLPHVERLAAAIPTLKAGDQPSAGFHRFGLRKDQPHLELHLPFPDPQQDDAAALFAGIVALAQAVRQ